ncbi:transglutaminase TgpA family protein [Halorientalis halophila]|uniref:transglutaminase TgpA family protein n=1 Tax=Halorientalis halophila TaxID=3108499 RepID=UPI00300B3EAC
MSTEPGERGLRGVPTGLDRESAVGPRALALLSAGLLLFSFTFPLYGIIDVVGDPDTFLLVVAATLVVATGLSQVLRARTALTVGIGLLVLGLWSYASALPADVFAQQGRIARDVFSLLTGLSVLRLQMIELFVLAYTPAPVFLTWFLALRRRYVATAFVGGAALSFFVLTGDVGTLVALLGALGAVGTVGFGRLERFGGDARAVETLAIVLAAIVVVTLTVSVVPGGSDQPFGIFDDAGTDTIEGSLITADERVSIQGEISLSSAVRFRVESDEEAYWRTAAYDRYTGDGWVRTGGKADYPGEMPGPPGESRVIQQRVTAESRIDVLPAAWKPVAVSESRADETEVTSMGGLRPTQGLTPGDSYTVVSRQPVASPDRLRRAGRDYPPAIEDRYTNLPASTPDRVARRTERVTAAAGADSPYETARAIQSHLQSQKSYSLEVARPEEDVAATFLFEMDEGYCTYFATTMVTMLRTQDVPARFVVGYTPGEQVDDDEYVVRGLDSHAWVEVYVPDVGWVQFDPTPADPRRDAEQDALDGSGSGDFGDEDDDELETTAPPIPDEPETTTEPTTSADDDGRNTTAAQEIDASAVPTTHDARGGGGLPDLPSREEAALVLVVLGGAVAGARRTGLTDRAYRAVWLRWQPRRDPERDVQRAFERVEYVLARAERPRRPGETPRQYLAAIDADEATARLYRLHERAQYAGRVTADEADDAVATAGEIVGERWGRFG